MVFHQANVPKKYHDKELRSMQLGQIEAAQEWFNKYAIKQITDAITSINPALKGIFKAGTAAFDLVNALVKNEEKNKKVDRALKMSDYDKLSDVAYIGAAITFTSSGGILFNHIIIEVDKLEEDLEVYKVETGISLDVQDFISFLLTEDDEINNDRIKKYVDWYRSVHDQK